MFYAKKENAKQVTCCSTRDDAMAVAHQVQSQLRKQ